MEDEKRERTYLVIATNYIIQFPNTVNGNYTNVYPIKIYQLIRIFLCENNVSEGERRKKNILVFSSMLTSILGMLCM